MRDCLKIVLLLLCVGRLCAADYWGAVGADSNGVVKAPSNFWPRQTNDPAFGGVIGKLIGSSNLVTAAQVGVQIGSSNLVTAAQVGVQIGSSNLVTAAQVGARIGSSNLVTAAQVATQIASSNLINSAQVATQIGASNTVTAGLVDSRIGYWDLVSSSWVAATIASSNLINSAQVATQIGASNTVTASSVAAQIASSNFLATVPASIPAANFATNIIPAVQWLSIVSNAVTLNGALGNKYALLLTTNVYMSQPTNLQAMKDFMLDIRQDATGGRAVTWDARFWKFSSGILPTVTTNASAWTVLSMVTDCYGTNVGVIQTPDVK